MKKPFVFLSLSLALAACEKDPNTTYSGYVEADTASIAAPYSGWLEAVYVDRGSAISPDQPLFQLDATSAGHALSGAQSRLEAANANATDLTKGARSVDIAPLLAQRQKAMADLELARSNEGRFAALEPKGYVSATRMDQLRATTRAAEAQLAQIDRSIDDLKAAAREDQQKAAQSNAAATEADVKSAQYNVTERSVKARLGGSVEDRLREPGEYVTAGTPVLTVHLKDRHFVRFFVPQNQLAAFKVGQSVNISCDGCQKGLTAKVRYIAPKAEYTPPVIFSVRERQKMMFLIEATPDKPEALPLGIGVDVTAQIKH